MRLSEDSGDDAVYVSEVKMKAFPVVNLGQAVPVSSVGEQWWTHHIANTRAYAEAALAGDTAAAVEAVKELWRAVLDWQNITGSPVAGVLIAEHTALAKLLVDCFASDAGEACTSTAVDAVVRNVETHRALFPKDPDRFSDLFGRHSELAGAYITDLAAEDMESFDRHFAEAIENGQELAAFTDRVFVPSFRRGLSGPKLGQAAPANYITTEEFRAYVEQAKSSIKKVSDIAKDCGLSEADLQIINSEAGKVSSYTVPMANIPTGPSPWLFAAGGLAAGLLVGSAI